VSKYNFFCLSWFFSSSTFSKSFHHYKKMLH